MGNYRPNYKTHNCCKAVTVGLHVLVMCTGSQRCWKLFISGGPKHLGCALHFIRRAPV